MKPEYRIVTSIPMTEIWNADGVVSKTREKYISAQEIKRLLRTCPIQFALADVGKPLYWIPKEKTFDFWKDEVKRRLIDPATERIMVSDLPEEYCYRASMWKASSGDTIVLLEMEH